MPTAEAITRVLHAMSGELAWLALAWHVVIVAALIALVRGWRPSSRVVCLLLTAPIMSVAVASFGYGNLFNAISFAVLALWLAVLGEGLAQPHVERGPAWATATGLASIAFGLTYPHFIDGPWYTAVVTAPIGVVPCPTLAFVAGAVILAGGLGSRWIPSVLGAWVAFYAWFGIQHLGVALDLGLLVALLGLIGSIRTSRANRSGAARHERRILARGRRIVQRRRMFVDARRPM